MNIYHIAVGLVPVCAFLAGLIALDSFKLVPLRSVLQALAVGAIVAAACLFVNTTLIRTLPVTAAHFSRYVAPTVEELFKVAFLLILIRTRRIAFLVDAAIYGFAIGAGFALVENIYFLAKLSDSNTLVWLVRGFGTAALHGATLIVAGVITKTLVDRYPESRLVALVPGVLLGIMLHSAFNHFVLSPVLSTAVILMTFPFVVLVVFEISNKATRKWLVSGWDSDVELLEAITEGDIADSAVGKYLDKLQGRFPSAIIADMLCLLHLHLELTMTAKGVLLARDAGVDLPKDPALKGRFEELTYLEKAIGKTGLMTLAPLLPARDHHSWQRQLLQSR